MSIVGPTHDLSPPYLFLLLSLFLNPLLSVSSRSRIPRRRLYLLTSSYPWRGEGAGVMFCWATVGRALRADGGGGGPKALDDGASRARVAARPATASYVAAGVDWLGGAATAVPQSCNRGRRKLEPRSSGAARLLHAGEGVLQPWMRKAGSVVRRSYNQIRWSCELFSSEFVFAGTDLFFCWKLFFCRTTDASRRAGGNDVDQGDAATMANRELELTGGGD
ncbi:uncharacterized protein LOC125556221 isoform X2 [Triticum urartu]|uniref:uncharacterized protein LOC125556221 isoform X2 n=1 Tax=Triticum urartu TaxID=4572 RepID=UPI0020437DE2|nr:uncharacterized protein LOC125556221 isoform X2 [Triticum urartu]